MLIKRHPRTKDERLSSGLVRCLNCHSSFTRQGLDTHDRKNCMNKVSRIKKLDGFYTCFPGCEPTKNKLEFLWHMLNEHEEELNREGYPSERLVD